MKKVLQRGFTLIELLVVIAIIGILAAVVLASLNDARESGGDASIQQTLGNARSQAEIVYNRDGAFSYDAVCTDPQITNLASSTDETNGSTGNVFCNDDATNWVLAAELVSSSSVAWCVDSTGFAGRTTLPTGSDLECNP